MVFNQLFNLFSRYGTYCQECLRQVKAVIPCRRCCGVSFCSVSCRDAALGSYHQYECGINDILIATGLNIHPFLTIRIITRYTVHTALHTHEGGSGGG